MEVYYDPFGFTKQTAMLLRGLGASELIPECKMKNISTDTLHQLSELDIIKLGASARKAEEIKKSLNVKRKSGFIAPNVQERIQHFLETIKNGEQQLSLIQAFVAYCRLRLVKERINCFVDPDKCISASEILPASVNATLAEVEETKRILTELEEVILRQRVKPKRNDTRRICILIGGLGLVTLVLFKIYSK